MVTCHFKPKRQQPLLGSQASQHMPKWQRAPLRKVAARMKMMTLITVDASTAPRPIHTHQYCGSGQWGGGEVSGLGQAVEQCRGTSVAAKAQLVAKYAAPSKTKPGCVIPTAGCLWRAHLGAKAAEDEHRLAHGGALGLGGVVGEAAGAREVGEEKAAR